MNIFSLNNNRIMLKVFDMQELLSHMYYYKMTNNFKNMKQYETKKSLHNFITFFSQKLWLFY